VRQRALEDGKTVYMAVPRLAGPEPFFALDPDHLSDRRQRHGPRPAAGICWEDLTEEKIATVPLLAAQRRDATRS
jgi:5-formyltetrahydrofolate cyclo-ligase